MTRARPDAMPGAAPVRRHTLAISACDFGWGSVGKLRLILGELPGMDLVLHRMPDMARGLLALEGTDHRIIAGDISDATAALVVNDPVAADELAERGVPVIYVDSLPYLWASPQEVPKPGSTAVYCAQKYPREMMPAAAALSCRPDMKWIDPIVPESRRRSGGEGIVLNIGGLHSHLSDGHPMAYEQLVLPAAVDALARAPQPILAICGNVSPAMADRLRPTVGEATLVGPQPACTFEGLLKRADLLVSSPGSTTLLQAMAIGLPTALLPPQNLSQLFNARLFSRPDRRPLSWPEAVLSPARIEALRPEGEEAVVRYIYRALARAATDPAAVAAVSAAIRAAFDPLPTEGDLRDVVTELGGSGAAQVARLVRQACLAPFAA